MGPLLNCQNLSLTIDSEVLLQDINFQISTSDFGGHLVIFGPNGAGKTLLTQVISGNLPPTSGQVTLLGQNLYGASYHQVKQKIGYVSPKLFDDFAHETPAEEVVMSGLFGSIGVTQSPNSKTNQVVKNFLTKVTTQKLHGHNRALAAMEKMHISHLAGHTFGDLSYGQKSRTLLARALITKPEILILDEATTGLDLAFRAEFTALTQRLAKTLPIILITHYLEEVTKEFQKVLLLKKGQTFRFGLKEDLFTSNYLSTLFNIPLKVKLDPSSDQYSVCF